MERIAFSVLLITAFMTALLMPSPVKAYFNVTYLNTTVFLNKNTSAYVVETLTLYVSNSSINQYILDTRAINLTLSDWQNAINTNLLVEHILNPKSNLYDFKFSPGALAVYGNYGYAQLEMSYYVANVTTVKNIGPRKFEYTFDDNVFNFQHSASGQILPQNAQLNMIVPKGAQIVNVYPPPNLPNKFGILVNYTNVTKLSWYSGEPLSSFNFTFIITESPGQEVFNFFNRIYTQYEYLIYAVVILVIILIISYLYIKTTRPKV